MTLTPIDATNEVAVSDYLTRARDWLSTAVEMTGPEQIAMAKAEIATAAEATKQLGLSKEIQLDAQEMVRRAEYALARSIRKGQAEGTVGVPSSGKSSSDTGLPRPSDFASPSELYPNPKQAGIYDLGDGIDEDDFDDALAEAKAEGNLSRANVARKAAEKTGAPRASRRKPLPEFARDAGWDLRKAVERLERIADDDRFVANKEQVATHLRGHLSNAVEVCQDLLARIDNN